MGDRFIGGFDAAVLQLSSPGRRQSLTPSTRRGRVRLPPPPGDTVATSWVTGNRLVGGESGRQELQVSLLQAELLGAGGGSGGCLLGGGGMGGGGSSPARPGRSAGVLGALAVDADGARGEDAGWAAAGLGQGLPHAGAAAAGAENAGGATGSGGGEAHLHPPAPRRIRSFFGGVGGGSGGGGALTPADAGGAGAAAAAFDTRAPARGGGGAQASPASRALAADTASAAVAGGSPMRGMLQLSPGTLRLLDSGRVPVRSVMRQPIRVLDSPGLIDDFYLNLLDWSSLGVVAVALGECVYLYQPEGGSIRTLANWAQSPLKDRLGDDAPAGVAWSGLGGFLAVGTNRGSVVMFDAATGTAVRRMEGHNSRVSALSFAAYVLATGGRDGNILLRDLRAPEPYVGKVKKAHTAQACSLRFSPDWGQLASGGNDNQAKVWEHRMLGARERSGGSGGGSPRPAPALLWSFADHIAGIKALAWSPHRAGVLAVGAGTKDKSLSFYSTSTGAVINRVDTGSQVCTALWSVTTDEVVTTHGYSAHSVVVWRYPTLRRVVTLEGHSQRVLYSALSPDGSTVVTGAGDHTLRFWRVFPALVGTGGGGCGGDVVVDQGGRGGDYGGEALVGSAFMVSPLREGRARNVHEVR